MLKFNSIVLFIYYLSLTEAVNYLKERRTYVKLVKKTIIEKFKFSAQFLRPCRIHNEQDTQCLIQDVQNLLINWRNDVAGFKQLGSIDPFRIKKLRLQQRAEGIADVQLDIRNASVTGLSKARVLQTKVNVKDYTIYMQLNVPHSKMHAAYKLKGRILLLNLDGQGDMQMELSDVDVNIAVKTKLLKRGEHYFFDVQSINTDLSKIGNFHIHFSNLFNGNKELENSAHELFNSSWRSAFDALRPAISQTWDSIMRDRYKRLFDFIPANYFVSDLP